MRLAELPGCCGVNVIYNFPDYEKVTKTQLNEHIDTWVAIQLIALTQEQVQLHGPALCEFGFKEVMIGNNLRTHNDIHLFVKQQHKPRYLPRPRTEKTQYAPARRKTR